MLFICSSIDLFRNIVQWVVLLNMVHLPFSKSVIMKWENLDSLHMSLGIFISFSIFMRGSNMSSSIDLSFNIFSVLFSIVFLCLNFNWSLSYKGSYKFWWLADILMISTTLCDSSASMWSFPLFCSSVDSLVSSISISLEE